MKRQYLIRRERAVRATVGSLAANASRGLVEWTVALAPLVLMLGVIYYFVI